ncbi:MAG: type II toxin-antitoxin system VapC family toxin [Spirochaeta sp.]|nr:type II toxin-antitoxin system VapC family toxin [Spirochaeta sp.]
MIILDTCALLWLAQGSGRLTEETLLRIDKEQDVTVSAISAFEIAIKYKKGKLSLAIPSEEWWHRAIQHHRLEVLSLTAQTMISATRLPAIHSDPADRFIIAAAIERSVPVVTADARFTEYGVSVFC